MKKSKTEPDTIIYDRQGYSNEGYCCKCPGCPYNVDDCCGESACYKECYERCKVR